MSRIPKPGDIVFLGHGGRASTLTPGWPETLEYRDPSAAIIFDGHTRYFSGETECGPPHPDPLESVVETVQRYRGEVSAAKLSTDLSAPCCILALSYEFLQQTEGIGLKNSEPAVPSLVALFYDRALPGHGVHRRALSTGLDFGSAPPLCFPLFSGPGGAGPEGFELDKAQYGQRVSNIRTGIGSGNYYVVNLSQRARYPYGGDAGKIWKRWALDYPMPYRTYAHLGFTELLVNSPECFLRRRGSWLETFPIKGTRRRTGITGEDQLESIRLREDPKELAEHRMIVDLERNDLGKVARTGSVEVPVRERIDVLPGLLHMVSAVRCQVSEPGIAVLPQIIRATFPGGSVTGAPKKAAIRAIDSEEVSPRGFYTGALFAIDRDGNFEAAMLIRTAMTSGSGGMILGSGGGVVFDSDPLREAEEVSLKLEGFHATLARLGGKH